MQPPSVEHVDTGYLRRSTVILVSISIFYYDRCSYILRRRQAQKNVKLSSSVKCCIVDNSNSHDSSSYGRRQTSRVRVHIQSTRQDTLYIIIVRTYSTCIPEITRRAPRVSLSDGQLLLLPVYRVELV